MQDGDIVYNITTHKEKRVIVQGVVIEFEDETVVLYRSPSDKKKINIDTDMSNWYPSPMEAIKGVKAIMQEAFKKKLLDLELLERDV